jgi:hypothetical protein
MSDSEIIQAASTRLKHSEVVVDAVVTNRTADSVILKPLRVWKGPRLPAYTVEDHHCGIYFPHRGSKLRVLLARSPFDRNQWEVVDPALGGSIDYRRFDKAIDALLGSSRPKSYESISGVLPPDP